MSRREHTDPPQPHTEQGSPPVTGQGQLQRVPPALWQEFGMQVLAAHHRNYFGAQCVCGSLTYHCPVIEAAQRLGLPTDDPRGHV